MQATSHNTASHYRVLALRMMVVLVILQLAIALLTQDLCLSFDESVWTYIGRNWLRHGMTPYSGGVDNKSPLIFFIYGLSDSLFGINYWFSRVAGVLIQSIGLYYLYKLARKSGGEKAGLLALSLYGLSLLWRSTAGKHTGVTETYATCLLILSFYKFLHSEKQGDLFWSGVFAGLAVAFRQTSLFGMLAIFIYSASRNFRSSLVFVSGVVASLLVISIVLVGAGIHLNDLLVYGIYENFAPGNDIYHRSLLWKAENFLNGFFYSEMVLFYPGLIGYILVKKKLDIVLVWLILEFICINLMGIYAKEHFKNLLPPLALANAFFLTHLAEHYGISFKALLWIIWLCFFPKTIEPFIAIKQLSGKTDERNTNDEFQKKKLGEWIRDHTKEEAFVLIPGLQPQIMTYSERRSPTVYFINIPQSPRAKERFVSDVGSHRPDMIVIPPSFDYTDYLHQDLRNFIERLIQEEYVQDTAIFDFRIYRRFRGSDKF